MTHQEDPWLKTQRNEEIPLPLIKNYFEKHILLINGKVKAKTRK